MKTQAWHESSLKSSFTRSRTEKRHCSYKLQKRKSHERKLDFISGKDRFSFETWDFQTYLITGNLGKNHLFIYYKIAKSR